MQKLPDKLYLACQVKALERIAIDDHGIPGFDLMHKAGTAVFELIKQQYPGFDLVIFCGAGNNAGDGYVVAKLALQAGVSVKVYPLSNPERLKGDALTAYQQYIQAKGEVLVFNLNICIKECIIVDALLGTGLSRQVSGYYSDAIKLINFSVQPVISIDLPSGLNADTGNIMGCAVKADYTVSFIGLKQGLFTGLAAEYCGEIVYSSLDICNDVYKQVDYASRLISSPCLPERHQCAHKGDNGHLLVIGGEVGFSGAVLLAAEAALRIGSGLVSIATRKSHASVIGLTRPELMCHAIGRANSLISLIDKATVIVIGPGLGQTQWANDLLQKVLDSKKPLVCDADALNLLANQQTHNNNWVLTPHPGEAARLLRCSTADIANDRFAAISELQKKYGGVIVLKGAGTLIHNGNETYISITGNPGMASGGMGDTLAGMIGGLIAQKLDLFNAATTAVYLHGKAADQSAEEKGEIGMIASDLMPHIRKLVNG